MARLDNRSPKTTKTAKAVVLKYNINVVKKHMKNNKLRLALVLATAFVTNSISAQNLTIKTNALYWSTVTPNLAIEAKTGEKWTAELSVGWNPFTFSNNKKLKHIAIQPEARYWLCSPFAGHFFGLHAIYSHSRFQGDLGAIGIGYGYSWMLPGNHWSIEAEVGVGVGVTKYDKYECATCGSKVGSETKTILMPTKAAISLIYNIK